METVIQTVVLMGSLGALMWAMLKFMLRDIHKDLANIKSEITEIKVDMRKNEARTDRLYQEINHLYEICIGILQTRK